MAVQQTSGLDPSLTKLSLKEFTSRLRAWHKKHGRHDLPWRTNTSPYAIVVSEVMLQQTQVDRVISFFRAWMRAFPNFKRLAEAKQSDVLRFWKGLGYNSRALRLQKLAQVVITKHRGRLPDTYDELVALPGVGPYTAGAVLAFAYDIGVPIIETNIRRVYIHHFFDEQSGVSDHEILEKVTATLPQKNARTWYWALMDYGAYLAKVIPNPNKRSRHYSVQSRFEGSNRQVRGQILDLLLGQPRMTLSRIQKKLDVPMSRLQGIVGDLQTEGFIKRAGKSIELV